MTSSARSCRASAVLGALAVALAAGCAAALLFGSSSVGARDLLALATGADVDPVARNILVTVRIPRVLAAVLAGCALATAGAVIQAVLDNPLASPGVIGVNSGAGLAVLLASSLAPGIAAALPLVAFGGALATSALVFAISARAGTSRLTIVLAGMALTAVFGAGMNAVLIVDPDAYIGASTFLVGGLSGVQMPALAVPAALIAAGLAASALLARRLDALSLGDVTARSIGMDVTRMRLASLAVASVLAGAAVSFAGLLGFVGLVVPHLVRFLAGRSNRLVVPASALAGALLVVVCDLLARVLFAPYELPVGILMAFLGGPFFIYLILRRRDAHV